MTRTLAAIALAIAVVATACGGGDDTADSSTSDPRAAELATALAGDERLAMSDADATCTANGIVGELDESAIDALVDGTGFALDQLETPDQAIAAFDAYLDCVDLEQQMIESLLDDGTEEATARCIAQSFGEDDLRTILGASVLPGGAVDEEAAFSLIGQIFEAAQACVDG